MATIRDLRQRLELIKNIRQYTMALEIISATRLKKAKPIAEHSTLFYTKLEEILRTMVLSNADGSSPLLQPRKEINKPGIIVVASDKGHSGVFNSSIMKETERVLSNYTRQNAELVLIGDKAISYFQQKKWPIALKISKWTGKITREEIQKIADQCKDWFITEKMDAVKIIYMNHYGMMKKEIAVENFLPISFEKPEQAYYPPEPLFEPASEEIYEKILSYYVFFHLKRILETSYHWELLARNLAMQMASKNAQSLGEKVTILLNKVRQADITKEALEIATSAITLLE